ncbi:Hpt domain-containing protein [Paenarthrobacter sp. 2TAF44]|uniref:Hpt domain-containing protein n=1 Tax=Paenarthrobacter sp. 2TAF44 TaxID=3233018 RepID=UPI003F9A72B2
MFSSDFSEVDERGDSDHIGPAEGSTWKPDADRRPILDLAEFQLLEDQVGDPGIARKFASDFARLWRVRYESLATAVEHGDEAAALDTILSLRTSSAMVGGVRLSVLAALLEEHILNGELRNAQPLLDEIAECGQRTVKELRKSYVLRNESPEPDPIS